MSEAEEICSNCKQNVPAKNFFIHTVHCEKRVKLCDLCNEAILKTEFDEHLRENHTTDSCTYCKNPFEKIQLENHEKKCNMQFACTYSDDESDDEKYINTNYESTLPSKLEEKNKAKNVLVVCKYCKLEYPQQEYSEHELACGSRTEKCQKCDTYVKLMEIENHCCSIKKNKWKNLLVVCKYCELEYPQKEYCEHELMCGSRTEKCEKCNAYVKLMEIENHRCSYRKKSFEYDVGKFETCCFCKVKFKSKDIEDHIRNCAERIVKCTNCDLNVMLRDKIKHENSCSLNSYDKCLVSCTHCKAEVPLNSIPNHMDICEEGFENCGKCKKQIKKKDVVKHKELCKNNESWEYSECPICLENIPSYIIKSHFDQCVSINSNNLISEEYSANGFVNRPSQFGKETEVASLKETTQCPYCSKDVPPKRLQNHKKYCEQALKTCPHCLEKYHIEEADSHSISCDVINSNDWGANKFKDSNNRYDLLQNENEWREAESNSKRCEICNNLISKKSYGKHVRNCKKSLKQCSFCNEKFHKTEGQRHFQTCKGLHKSHSEHGARPKIKNKAEAENSGGFFNRMFKGIHSYISPEPDGYNARNNFRNQNYKNSAYSNNQGNYVTDKKLQGHYQDATVTRNKFSQVEDFYICEFCNKKLPMDQLEIATHDSGCQPDLIGYPSDKSGEKKKSPTSTLIDPNHDHLSYNSDKVLISKNDCTDEMETSTAQIAKEDNFTFMTHFNKKYNHQTKEASGELTFKDTKSQKIMQNTVNNYESNVTSDYLDSEIKKITYAENADNAKSESSKGMFYPNQNEKFTKPGEFLEHDYDVKEGGCQPDLISYPSDKSGEIKKSLTSTPIDQNHDPVSYDGENDATDKTETSIARMENEETFTFMTHLNKYSRPFFEASGEEEKDFISKDCSNSLKLMKNTVNNHENNITTDYSDSEKKKTIRCADDASFKNSKRLFCSNQNGNFTKPGEFLENDYDVKERSFIPQNLEHSNQSYEMHLSDKINKKTTSKENGDDKLYHSWQVLDSDNESLVEKLYSNKFETYENSSHYVEDNDLSSRKSNNQNEIDESNSENSVFNDFSIISTTEVKAGIKIERLKFIKTVIQEDECFEQVKHCNVVTEKIYSEENKNLPLRVSDEYFEQPSSEEYEPTGNIENAQMAKKIHAEDVSADDIEKIMHKYLLRRNPHSRDQTDQTPESLVFTDHNVSDKWEETFEHSNSKEFKNYKESDLDCITNRLENISLTEISNNFKSEEQPMEIENYQSFKEDCNILGGNNFYAHGNVISYRNSSNDVGSSYTKERNEFIEKYDEKLLDMENKDDNMESYLRFLKCEKCGNEICICNIEESLSRNKWRSKPDSDSD